jgi:hypothetical protein
MHSRSGKAAWQRRRLIVISSAVALAAGATVVTANIAGAAGGSSALDYAQCSNGAPLTTPDPDCSWINGVLNANNSQFHEDEVTPQRLLVSFTDTAGGSHQHSVTLKYLDRKGGIHAYDYLAAANATVTDALDLRCLGIESICPSAAVSDSHAVAEDSHNVGPATNGFSTLVSTHMQGLTANQKLLHVYGATFSGVSGAVMTDPTHDNNAVNTGDDYATTKISFITPAGAGKHSVQLLFGGHLAAPTQTDGWGDNLGAASVSGGPYHIKWAAADDLSVGNRDNQIMSSAIIPIIPLGVTIVTTPNVTAATVGDSSLVTAHDGSSMTVGDNSHPPTGTMTFDLYGPYDAQGDVDCDAADLFTPAETGVALSGSGPYTATSSDVDLSGAGPGIYQWVAHYVHGSDPYNLDGDGACPDASEQVVISQATAVGTSTQTLTDSVDVTGFGTPTGHVDWYAYTTNDCSNAATFSDVWVSDDPLVDADSQNNILDNNGEATSEDFTPTPPAGGETYYWKVVYSGDTNNAAGNVEACGVQQATIQNAPL